MALPRFTLAIFTLRGIALYLAFGGAAAGCGEAASTPASASARFDPCAGVMLVPDGDLPAAVAAGVSAGIGLWNQAAHARVVMESQPVHPAADAPPPSGDVAAMPALPIHFQAAGAPFHGFYDPAGVQIFINTDLEGHDRIVAVAHEVGHAFGLVHVSPDERRSVMNSGNLDEEPNAGDVAALAALWGTCPSGAEPAAPVVTP